MVTNEKKIKLVEYVFNIVTLTLGVWFLVWGLGLWDYVFRDVVRTLAVFIGLMFVVHASIDIHEPVDKKDR